MVWLSRCNGAQIKRVFVVKDGVLHEAVDMYSVKDGAPRIWVREGYIPEHYYIIKEDDSFFFLSEEGMPVVTE